MHHLKAFWALERSESSFTVQILAWISRLLSRNKAHGTAFADAIQFVDAIHLGLSQVQGERKLKAWASRRKSDCPRRVCLAVKAR